jgi:hypothetical protein
MIDYPVLLLCELFRATEEQIGILKAIPDQTADLSEDFKWTTGEMKLSSLWQEQRRLGLSKDIGLRIDALQDHLMSGLRMSPEMLLRDLIALRNSLIVELDQRKFAYIPPPNDAYFERTNLLGVKVHERFPEISPDAKEAGNCISAGLYTAAVFHLMRVAEYGLRAIAKELRVKPLCRKKIVPIEEADWEMMIRAIRDKIEEIRQLPKTAKRRRVDLSEYSDAADHCAFMKDIWRNNVSHTQKPSIEPDALQALSRVRDFMVFLTRILPPAKVNT